MGVILMLGNRPYVDVPEAARRKGVSRQAVWEACRRKRLAARRHGRFWLIQLADLRKWHPDRARVAEAKGA